MAVMRRCVRLLRGHVCFDVETVTPDGWSKHTVFCIPSEVQHAALVWHRIRGPVKPAHRHHATCINPHRTTHAGRTRTWHGRQDVTYCAEAAVMRGSSYEYDIVPSSSLHPGQRARRVWLRGSCTEARRKTARLSRSGPVRGGRDSTNAVCVKEKIC